MRKDPKIPGKPTLDEHLPRSKTAANELPLPDTKRWARRRKALVVEAMVNDMITIEEICRRYHLSINEFLSWQKAIEMHGVPDLRTTRLQIYHDFRRRSASAGTDRLSKPRHEPRAEKG